MLTASANPVLDQLRRASLLGAGGEVSDGQLLGAFVSHGDEAAFETLVRRHGPMVHGLCRRVIGHRHDAEDAFQATFLVLARKAACVRPREAVANWLFGVAYRTARRARAVAARRSTRETQVKTMLQPSVEPADTFTSLCCQPILDEELNRLPDKYRLPVVLCELEGRPRRDVARHLQVPEGTLSSRLATARKLLAKGLRRRGVSLPAAALTTLLSGQALANVPSTLVSSTSKAAAAIAAGQALTPAVSGQVAALTEGVLKAMLMNKLRIVVAFLTVTVMFAFGAGIVGQAVLADKAHSTQKGVSTEPAKQPGAVGRAVQPASDADKLQGAWKVVRNVQNGFVAKQDPKDPVLRMYFLDGKLHEMYGEVHGGGPSYSFTLDPKEKPATIDLTSDYDGSTLEGIYRIEGETLTLCKPIRLSMERPTKFASEADSNLILLVLKRDPKAPKLDLEKVKAAQQRRLDRKPVVESLQKIVLAMYQYREDKGSLPARAIFDGQDKPLLSWRVALLPYLDEENLYNQFNLNEPWDSEHNKKLLAKMPSVYGDVGQDTVYQVFVGAGTAFEGTKAAKFEDFRDGASNSLLLAVAAQPVPWTKPADLSYAADKPLPKLGGIFKEGFHIAAGDGFVGFVPTNFKEKALRAVITIAGGEQETIRELQQSADGKDTKKEKK